VRGRAHVRTLFLRSLGLVFVAAFLSLAAQVRLLFGARGLLPACPHVARTPWWIAPSLLRVDCSDRALLAAALGGAAAALGLVLDILPCGSLVLCWLLYFSFVAIGQDFLAFQWDNLLLEAAFFALFVTPLGLRARDAPEPHPLGVLLVQWLVLRLYVESGLAKLLLGDPTWRDLTALVSYYETAPLPTWIGWWAHQMPVWVHRLCALYTYLAELVLPLAMWAPRRLRAPAFLGIAVMQAAIILTANYGFFNWLSLALTLFLLDDGYLARLAARLGRRLAPAPAPPPSRARTAVLAAATALLVPLSLVPFLPFVPGGIALSRRLGPVPEALAVLRTINAYHLFASMTGVRREVVIEGSADGVTWEPYELRWKPGDPRRAPAFVAPHQPRVDFQLWFLLLGHRGPSAYFETLLRRLLTDPPAMAPLFVRDPFPATPPRALRLAFYTYHFTDRATRRSTGAWWTRALDGYSRPITARDFPPPR